MTKTQTEEEFHPSLRKTRSGRWPHDIVINHLNQAPWTIIDALEVGIVQEDGVQRTIVVAQYGSRSIRNGPFLSNASLLRLR